jgi:hypothetical protein
METRKEIKIMAIDFDGTLVEEGEPYPNFGEVIPYSIRCLRWLQNHGVKLILWTCREGKALEKALAMFDSINFTFNAVNDNINDPAISNITFTCRKIYADVYIDNRSLPNTDMHSFWKNMWNDIIEYVGSTDNIDMEEE